MTKSPVPTPSTPTPLERARRKVYWRLLPLLFVCYVIAYVDRANVAIAKLTMTRDLPGFDNAVIGEAFISYLGFGVNPATPTWGNILSESAKFLQQGNWWWIGFPGLFIVLTSLSINMIGDTLRSALDPRGRK